MMPSSTRQNLNTSNTMSHKKRMATAHGPVKTVNKTGIMKLNKLMRKKGELTLKDFDSVGYKKVDMTDHKPPIKKKY